MINRKQITKMINNKEITGFKTISHKVDFCVVGGGLAGMFAAISAARQGSKVLLMQDRPVLGGNASSEIRMWIRGAHGEYKKETGLLEELEMANAYRNPNMNFSIWDSVLYEMVKFQENIKLVLNCSCCDAKMDGNKIVSIKGWQTTTQTWQEVSAEIFADCSGDSVLAPLTGAEYRMGRESCDEFSEDIAPKESDNLTMGMSCLFQARETTRKVGFKAPKWANKYTKEDFKGKIKFDDPTKWTNDNYWWMEIGGVYNSIDDTEDLKDELLKIAYGSWDYIKNSGDLEADNWELEWLGFLPGKRESRRYVGDYIMTQNDIRSEGRFDDLVAYGGWSMDDHHPEGFETTEPPTIFHPAPSPYGIPYRSLYSKNIDNLMFAGRNISATHSALSSCRVMSTCSVIGQAMGTAAGIAITYKLSPRGVYKEKINELKQKLMDDDCYLPFNIREMPELMKKAKISSNTGDVSLLTNGIERVINDVDNAWEGSVGDEIVLSFDNKTMIDTLRIVFDSDIERKSWQNKEQVYLKRFAMKCNTKLSDRAVSIPNTITKTFDVFVENDNGEWEIIYSEKENYNRMIKIKISKETKKLKFVPKETWGYEKVRIYGFDVR